MDGNAYERAEGGERAGSWLDTIEVIEQSLCHLGNGRILASEGRLDEAERELRRALEAAPNMTDAHYLLAQIYTQQSRALDAMRAYLDTIALDPTHAPALHGLALCLREHGLPTSIDLLRRAIEHAPDEVEHYRALGTTQLLQQNATGAERAYRAWLDAHPNDSSMLRELGLMYYELGRRSEARRCLEEAVAADADDHEAMNNLAVIYLEMRRWHDAESLLLRSARLAPESFTTQANLARLYAILGRTDDAFEALARAVRLESSQAHAMMLREPLLRSLRADPRWNGLYQAG
jgi:Flp pilus assembly protein TadD